MGKRKELGDLGKRGAMKELNVPENDTSKSAFLCNNLKSFIMEFIWLLSFPLIKPSQI